MLTLQAQVRKGSWKKTSPKEREDLIPGVLYGPLTKSVSLAVTRKEFEKVFEQTGESALVSLDFNKNKAPVFVYDIQRDSLSNKVMHIDFYQPALDKKIEIMVPLVFEGLPSAVRDLGGTLIKNIQQVEVRALPGDLPHEIRVNVEKLATFDDKVLIKDVQVASNIEILRGKEDIVAQVVAPEKVEEELATPVEEKVEDVKKVEKPKKEEEVEEAAPAAEKKAAPKSA